MKRALATLGVAGLAWLSITAPAYADADFRICHDGRELWIDLNAGNGLAGHTRHDDDIIPPNELLRSGHNWDAQGMADYANACAPVTLTPVADPPLVVDPPVVSDPVIADPPPVVDPPITVDQPAQVEQPAAVTETPLAITAQAPAAAVSKGTNRGFNAQTAAGGAGGNIGWLSGLGALLGAGVVVAVRRGSRRESPTAG